MNAPTFGYPELNTVAPWRRRLSQRVEHAATGLSSWLLDHWLGIVNVALGFLLANAFLTPILAYWGIEPLASTMFRSYHAICDQIPSHSFFILGHQIALCSRNLALYGSIWLGSVFFRFARDKVRPLNWRWLLCFLLPMALDGGTQLFGWRESNVYLRLITGMLFGFGICWFALPFVQDAINESKTATPHAMLSNGAQVTPQP